MYDFKIYDFGFSDLFKSYIVLRKSYIISLRPRSDHSPHRRRQGHDAHEPVLSGVKSPDTSDAIVSVSIEDIVLITVSPQGTSLISPVER